MIGEEIIFVLGVILAVGAIGYFLIGDTMRLSPQEIAALARNAGFSGDDLTTAVAIALAESNGNPNAHGDTSLGTGRGSFGLWQIYSDAHPEFGPDFERLYDPQTNANAAFSVYQSAGFSFMPWSTYKSDAYLAFLSSAENGVNA